MLHDLALSSHPFDDPDELLRVAALLRQRDEHLRSLKALMGDTAHEINNLFVPLLGYVCLIKEEAGDKDTLVKYASKLENSARRASKFVTSILSATHPERRFAPKECNFAELVEAAIASWNETLGTSTPLHIARDLVPSTLIVDHEQ